MPFISKDWRDPGRLWIKTDQGWEEKIVIEKMGLLGEESSLSSQSDLLMALHTALATANQRESVANKLLSDSDQTSDEEKLWQYELLRARQKKSFIEWELSKRNSLILNEDKEYPHSTKVSIENTDEPCENISEDVQSNDNRSDNDMDDTHLPSSNKDNVLFLNINVKERVEYIERYKALIKDLSPFNDGNNETSKLCDFDDSTNGKSKDNRRRTKSEVVLSNAEQGEHRQSEDYPAISNDMSLSKICSCKDFSDTSGKMDVSDALLPPPPHCHITVKNTREVSGFNRLCEALKRLDFKGAVWDHRRFHYICKLIELLTTKKLRTLTGGSQKMLFMLLEEVASSVYRSQQNIHILRRLVGQLQDRLRHCVFLGKQLGSAPLWQQNSHRLHLIQAMATTIALHNPDDSTTHPNIQDLPEECLRAILLRLTNHNDLQCAGDAYSVMADIIEEQRIWRLLCKFHWSEQQLSYTMQHYSYLQQCPTDWKKVYTRLRRCYGLKEEYAMSLVLCKICHCLFWESLGHPCLLEQDPSWMDRVRHLSDHGDFFVRVPPQTFLTFFS